mgnify:CR=1 FL=1|jgi:hypothetical protein
MNKKNKRRLLAAGVLGMLGSKMAGAGASSFRGPGMRAIAGDVTGKKKSIFEKILSMGPGRNATSKKGGTLASSILSKNPFGLGAMDGAKYGKMIKANKGTYVKASCKLGRNKPTKIT